jgi:hypothetical protein
VARPRLRRAMRPPLAARVAQTAAPEAPLTAFWPGRGCRSRTAGRVSRYGLDRTGRGDTQRDALTRAGIQSPHRPSANAECHGVEAQELCLGNNHADPAAQGDRQRVRDYGSKPSDRGQRQRVCPRVVHAGTKLSVTATVSDGFRHVSYHGNRCVKNQHLCDKKPTSNQSSTSVGGRIPRAPCPSGSSVKSGLMPDAIAVCHRYPHVKAFYGKRASALTTDRVVRLTAWSLTPWSVGTWRNGCEPMPRGWASARSSAGSRSGPCSGVLRAGAQCRIVDHRPPITWTTCTSRVYGNSGTA